MREILLDFVTAIALLCGLVLAVDTAPRIVASVRRRRANRGGAFGVVVDRAGRVLGTYLDPFGHPWRTPRAHGAESPWVAAPAYGDPHPMAWEGFGASEEEALRAANRLRRRQLQLFAWLEDDGQEDDPLTLREPYLPPS
jgi:hypothetical protein